MTSLSDTTDDVGEPKLSYERVQNDLSEIIRTDTITSSCLHSKFFAIGTLCGRIHIFDHQGNKVNRKELCFHLKSVNCISIDERGEYLASCSNDRLVVYGLYDGKPYFNMMPDKPLNVVAIDPYFHRPDGKRRFISGDDKLLLYERGLFPGYKSTSLQAKEQKVLSISWQGQFVAWSTSHNVQVFDVEDSLIISRIKRDTTLEYHDNRDVCQFCWKGNRTLLVGWSNSVKICVIKERSREMLSETQLRGKLPKRFIEIVSMFETDSTICGLAPFNDNLITLSIRNPEVLNRGQSSRGTQSSDTLSLSSSMSSVTSPMQQISSNNINRTSTSVASTSLAATSPSTTSDSLNLTSKSFGEQLIKPQTHILETFPTSYNEISEDILTPNCCPTLASLSLSEKFPYTLLSIHNEGTYLIVCPKDIIVAKPRDYDDHIDWLMQHQMFKECHEFARENSKELVRHSLFEVNQIYMKHLIEQATPESFSEAGRVCAEICGQNQKLWDESIQNFSHLGQLKHLLPYVPKRVDGFHLEQQSYNFIFEDFLRNDSMSLFKAIKEIPHQLYGLHLISDKVTRNLANDPKNLILNEALAEIYIRMGNFEDAVKIYLDFNGTTRIFTIIRSNNLIAILRDRVDRLMQIDADETSRLLVENVDSISIRDIVSKLESFKSKKFLLSYLHRLALKDADLCMDYHELMVKLYAIHQPDSLLNFLKLSTNYRLEEALQVCKEANLIKEVVYLLGRMGDLRVALKYITESQGIEQAIDFCKEHQDSELWQDLIVYSMDKPKYIGALLKNIGTHISDPIGLIDRIPEGCEIEGLMPALVKVLQDYQLQISLEQSCRDLMASDCFTLLEKQINCQTQGISVKQEHCCDHCNQPLINERILDSMLSNTGPDGKTEPAGSKSPAAAMANEIVVFGCHHVFHDECCVDSGSGGDHLAPKVLTCRVCMLERDDENNHPTATATSSNTRQLYEQY